MSRARALLLALLGLALPVGLALGVYLASAGSLAAVPAVVEAPTNIARAASTTVSETQTTPPSTTSNVDGDLPGKCRKPENRLDPDCDPRSAEEDDDSSGHGSGGDDDDSSGPGSGGDDDGGDDSSGHGSGDDD
ncbi:MAG TPA: hypothetical protein VLA87_10960 [Gaiellaceae bacterium]|nr:hypothetical protein [Gaiellaceae bacterium]